MTGRKKAPYSTMETTIMRLDGDPQWFPKLSPDEPEPDHDLIRKQRIEDALAGEDAL